MQLYGFTRIVGDKKRHNIIDYDMTSKQIEDLLCDCQDNGYYFKYINSNFRFGACLEVLHPKDLTHNFVVCDTSAYWLKEWEGTGAENPAAAGIKPGLSPIVVEMLLHRATDSKKNTYTCHLKHTTTVR